MPRQLRVEYPGAAYHVMSRGDRREDILHDDVDRMAGRLGEHHAGELRRESAPAKAEGIIAEELPRLGWKEVDWEQRTKSDPEKLVLADSPHDLGLYMAAGDRMYTAQFTRREVLQTLAVEADLGLAWVTVPPGAMERHDVSPDDLDGLVEFARSVQGTRLAMLFRTLSNGRVKVSFRSVGDFDVAEFAHQFGGGGHAKASGASIGGAMEEVQRRVLDAARAALARPLLPR